MTIQTATLSTKRKEHTSHFSSALFQIIGGSLFIALFAQIKIPLFFTPIPLSLQTLAVMLVAGFLGRSKGTLAVLAYLGQLCLGLPVAAGGVTAPMALLGASGGYLVGFAVQAYLVGWCVERRQSMKTLTFFAALMLISFVQMGLGALWLGAFVGMSQAFAMGFLPFIPGDIVKVVAATTVLSKKRS